MKIIKIVILAIILIPIIGVSGIYAYVKIKNSIFYKHPTYLPSAARGSLYDSVSPGDLHLIINARWYEYSCTDLLNLSIFQVRKELANNYNYEPKSDSILNPPIGSVVRNSYIGLDGKTHGTPKDFVLVESKEIGSNGNYLFKKYSIKDTPFRIYELFWQTDRLALSIQANGRCISEVGADSELVKIAESMH